MASQSIAIYQGKRYVGVIVRGVSAEVCATVKADGLLNSESVSCFKLADGGFAVFGKEARQRAVFVYHDVPEPAMEEKSSTEINQA